MEKFHWPTNHPMSTTELSISIQISYANDAPVTSDFSQDISSATVPSPAPAATSTDVESQTPVPPVIYVYHTACGKCIHFGWCKHVRTNYSRPLRRCTCAPKSFTLTRLCIVADTVHTVHCEFATPQRRLFTLCRDCWQP